MDVARVQARSMDLAQNLVAKVVQLRPHFPIRLALRLAHGRLVLEGGQIRVPRGECSADLLVFAGNHAYASICVRIHVCKLCCRMHVCMFLRPRVLGAQPEPCMVTHTEELGKAPQYRRAHPRCPTPITTITAQVGDERQQDTHVRGFDTAVHLGELAVRQAEYLRTEEPPDVTYTMAGAPVCVCISLSIYIYIYRYGGLPGNGYT